VSSVDFARQLAEAHSSSSQSTKKFRSSAAPKGTKLPGAYVDRSKLREEESTDEKSERVKALEEMMKLQQIDEKTFIELRDEILGGEVASTHLVKGLDWKLLERVRKGEDVLNDYKKEKGNSEGNRDVVEADLEEEFERLEEKEIKALDKPEVSKKGEMAPSSLMPGKKRNRDQILAEMKAARKAAQEAKIPSLGAKFKKVGESRSEIRIERDKKGREVLITVDENGNEKRKVRRVQMEPEVEKGHGLLMPDKDAKPLGMEIPDLPKVAEEEEDMDIFDVGGDYDPLAGLIDEEDDAGLEGEPTNDAVEETKKKQEIGGIAPPPRPKQPAVLRNYFGDAISSQPREAEGPKANLDPTIIATLKKASTLSPLAKESESAEEAAKEARLKKMLQHDDRDAQDMDMGFGSSRFEDEEDFEEKKVKLSEWGGKDDAEEGGVKGEGKGKRKRGPKKRKGNGNTAADVMKILEGRRTANS
jgi:hypothetical protein